MKSRWLLFAVVSTVIIGLTACGKSPDLDAISSVCLVVDQDHPKVGEDFSLPIEEPVRDTLEAMGLDVLQPGDPCDASFTVSLTFDVYDASFPTETCSHGSEATGEARLEVEGFRTVKEPVRGRQVETALNYCYGKTADIIYRETLREAVVDAMVNVWGEPAVIALLERGSIPNLDEVFSEMFYRNLLSEREVVPVLILALDHEDELVQFNTMQVLLFKKQGEVIDILRRTDGIVDLLLEKVQPAHHLAIRSRATTLLGNLTLEPDRVVPILISLLDEENEDLRVSAINALSQYGPDAEEAIPALEAMLHDSSERIQNVAERALDEIR